MRPTSCMRFYRIAETIQNLDDTIFRTRFREGDWTKNGDTALYDAMRAP